ncbi:MAG: nickel-dependent lactate racemase [Anaerolineae bacterium]|nr:nickel-dependent lactate racemase [Anaerolineae bacterium]
MKILLAYGRSGLEVELPDEFEVIRPVHVPGLKDEAGAIRCALRQPIGAPSLHSLVKPGDRVVVAHSDITRATPNDRLLPPLLAELEQAGVRREDITLLCALGAHRKQTEAETRALLGEAIVERYCCLQHDGSDDAALVSLGQTKFGHPVRLNRLLVEADFKILTGFIEPHLYAGFSGGPKCVLPGLAGAESVLSNHGVDMISHPNARWGITEGNPLWEEMMDMALRIDRVFLLNVALNRAREITAVFAGDLCIAHREGCEFVRRHAMVKVEQPFDVVITTNSGYPLDQNLYQGAKGMSAAAQIVRQGGAILLVAACEDGLPGESNYARLLERAGSLQGVRDMLSQPGFSEMDQWGVQVQAQVQSKADVYVYSGCLSEEEIGKALLIPCRDLEEALLSLPARYGKRVCVLPEGPQVIAYV